MVFVQETVVKYSKEFLLKLRRVNYVTPKNYLDFINTYNKLLEEKDKYVLEQVRIWLYFYDNDTIAWHWIITKKCFIRLVFGRYIWTRASGANKEPSIKKQTCHYIDHWTL